MVLLTVFCFLFFCSQFFQQSEFSMWKMLQATACNCRVLLLRPCVAVFKNVLGRHHKSRVNILIYAQCPLARIACLLFSLVWPSKVKFSSRGFRKVGLLMRWATDPVLCICDRKSPAPQPGRSSATPAHCCEAGWGGGGPSRGWGTYRKLFWDPWSRSP